MLSLNDVMEEYEHSIMENGMALYGNMHFNKQDTSKHTKNQSASYSAHEPHFASVLV